ncbi:CelD/BcsL family acetyltransferase involved in cellulose biosynthesis [Parvibaculum indicum]|uniref:GNAT family N-acetyltransferase n=1 Tax=Parvibaculum indicum TaxID=562969 RepID=UPI00141FE873|nr:GNAT family N-acetyltransferase [Parvibaculum indicum]NIJ39864.1 CelD/BcsL family acetyltransferase involved in cellulose biosynthesis [Parvibaculum indicum]
MTQIKSQFEEFPSARPIGREELHEKAGLAAEGEVIQGPWAAVKPRVLLSVHEDLAEVREVWQQLEEEGDCSVFQTYAWLSNWTRHIGALRGVRPQIVVGWDASGEALFLFPMAIEGNLLARKLVWLGGELAEYPGPILAKNFARQVRPGQFPALWEDVRALLPKHHLVALNRMTRRTGEQANPFMELGGLSEHNCASHSTTLMADWDSYYDAKRSKSSKKRDRQKRRRMGELGEIAFAMHDEDGAKVETIEALMAQKARSFARMGVANIFDRPGYRDFYKALATDADSDIACVSSLTVGDDIVAANLCVSFGGRFYDLLASYDEASEAARFGPGVVQQMELMKHAIDTDHTVFDFTMGDEAYKATWCENTQYLYNHFDAQGVRGTIAAFPARGLIWLKRFVKKTPLFCNAYLKLRSCRSMLTFGRAAAVSA